MAFRNPTDWVPAPSARRYRGQESFGHLFPESHQDDHAEHGPHASVEAEEGPRLSESAGEF
jgi:hypothetical protein